MARMAVEVDMFKLIPGALLIAVLVQSTAASCKPPEPCDCPKHWKPVCGSDGRTYTNDCVLKCASQIYVENKLPPICVSSKGPCPEKDCTCPAVGPPVCGSNGVTYRNKCLLACENKHHEQKKMHPIHVAHVGECKTSQCPLISVPVCGSNNVTYKNICFLQEASRKSQARCKGPITLKSVGECIDDRCVICPSYIDPICASDGHTYDNACLLSCKNSRRIKSGQKRLTIVHRGHCTGCTCTEEYNPVCASDGNTYSNACFLKCENKKRQNNNQKPLTITAKGVCLSCGCTKQWDPVCGSDGKTYGNICMFNCENLCRIRQGKPILMIRNLGECRKRVECACTDEYKPVCGDDGKMYGNICELECESKRRENKGLPPIQPTNNHQCVEIDCFCTKIGDPVCGTDGKTYGNPCELACDNKRREKLGKPPIKIDYRGKCAVCICPLNIAPVCGSDGITYSNICLLECENTKRKKQGKKPIKKLYDGECCVCNKKNYKPVCGSDGNTYPNIGCFNCEKLRRPNLTISHLGACVDCACIALYRPVCGSDGKTYGNSCELGCASKRQEAAGKPPITQKSQGQCVPVSDSSCACAQYDDPVCASDGKTYITFINKGCLYCANVERERKGLKKLTLIHKGACQNGCACDKECDPDTWKPVCDNNGITHPNIDCFNCQNIRHVKAGLPLLLIAKYGPCEDCICPAIYAPVCGSDGKTYGNGCALGCKNIQLKIQCKPPLHIIRKGRCDFGCPKNWDPVCGSDGKTYGNKCVFDAENVACARKNWPLLTTRPGECRTAAQTPKPAERKEAAPCETENVEHKRKGLKELTVIHKGNYQNGCVCNKECDPDTWKPVCDNKGTTHPNIDCLNCVNIHRVKAGLPLLLIAKFGPCEDCICPAIYAPICGSDGKTYGNRCALDCHNIRRKIQCKPPLHVIREGSCDFGCPKNYDPVCGSDGKTYGNKCVFDAENVARARKNLPLLTSRPGKCRTAAQTLKPAERKEAAPCETA